MSDNVRDRLTNPHAMDIYDIEPGQAEVTQSTRHLISCRLKGAGTGKAQHPGLRLAETQESCSIFAC